MPVAATPLFPFVDALYDFDLCRQIGEWAEEGLSAEAMCQRIHDEKGVRPGRSSMARWIAGDCK